MAQTILGAAEEVFGLRRSGDERGWDEVIPAIRNLTMRGAPMSDAAGLDHNKALVRKIVEEMFNRGNLEVAPEIFAADFVDRGHERRARGCRRGASDCRATHNAADRPGRTSISAARDARTLARAARGRGAKIDAGRTDGRNRPDEG